MNNDNKKYPTPRGASATAAKRKYNEKKYDRFELSLPKGMKEKIDEVAKATGHGSRRAFILAIIEEKYEQVLGKKLSLEEPEPINDVPPGLEGMLNVPDDTSGYFSEDDDLPF